MEELSPTITRGQTTIDVPINNKYVRFVVPAQGPGNYQSTNRAILESQNPKMRLPTGEEMAFFLGDVYGVHKDQPEAREIQRVIRDRWLWVPIVNFWTPEGVYCVTDLNAQGISMESTQEGLEKQLIGAKEIDGVRFSRNGTVRFAQRDSYKEGEQSSEEFAMNGFIRAQYREQGAKKLAEVSKCFEMDPYVWTLNTDKDLVKRVSALDDCNGNRLNVIGDYFGDNDDSYSVGVLRATEGSEPTQ